MIRVERPKNIKPFDVRRTLLLTSLLVIPLFSILLSGCSEDNYYLAKPGFQEYTFLDFAVSCTEFFNISINRTEYCVAPKYPSGFGYNASSGEWLEVCCEYKSDVCFRDNEENSTSGLDNLCLYNVSNTSEVFLTVTPYGERALCMMNGTSWVDVWVNSSNASTICNDDSNVGLYSSSFNSGWNVTCCVSPSAVV